MACLKDLPNQGEAIGVHSAGGKPYEGITLLYPAAINDCVLFYSSYCKAGHVVLPLAVEPGHLCSLHSTDNSCHLAHNTTSLPNSLQSA